MKRFMFFAIALLALVGLNSCSEKEDYMDVYYSNGTVTVNLKYKGVASFAVSDTTLLQMELNDGFKRVFSESINETTKGYLCSCLSDAFTNYIDIDQFDINPIEASNSVVHTTQSLVYIDGVAKMADGTKKTFRLDIVCPKQYKFIVR